MRHYEIVFLVHPDQSEQVRAMVDRYRANVESDGGRVHRFEDWGRRQLAYPIEMVHKAHYVLMNVECTPRALEELEAGFRFNDAVLRNLVLARDEAVTEESAMAKAKEEKAPRERSRARESDAPKASGVFRIVEFEEGGVAGEPSHLRLVCRTEDGGKMAIWGREENRRNIDAVLDAGAPCTVESEYRDPKPELAERFGHTHLVRQEYRLRVVEDGEEPAAGGGESASGAEPASETAASAAASEAAAAPDEAAAAEDGAAAEGAGAAEIGDAAEGEAAAESGGSEEGMSAAEGEAAAESEAAAEDEGAAGGGDAEEGREAAGDEGAGSSGEDGAGSETTGRS